MRPPLVCEECGSLVAPQLAETHTAWHVSLQAKPEAQEQPSTTKAKDVTK